MNDTSSAATSTNSVMVGHRPGEPGLAHHVAAAARDVLGEAGGDHPGVVHPADSAKPMPTAPSAL